MQTLTRRIVRPLRVVLGMTKTAHLYAGVMEQAYIRDLKSRARNGLGVRIASPAPLIFTSFLQIGKTIDSGTDYVLTFK